MHSTSSKCHAPCNGRSTTFCDNTYNLQDSSHELDIGEPQLWAAGCSWRPDHRHMVQERVQCVVDITFIAFPVQV